MKKLCFNQGFIPRTWSNDDVGGDGCPIDLVDVSRRREPKPILTVSDFLVLGVLGLIRKGRFDYKIIALDVDEARERKISTLDHMFRQDQQKLNDVSKWFASHSQLGIDKGSKLLWSGEIKGQQYAMDIINEHRNFYSVLTDLPTLQIKKEYWSSDATVTESEEHYD